MTSFPWHQAVWQQFIHRYQQQRLPHALLMTGTRGLAQTALAEEMAKFILCQDNQKTSSSCNHCHSCQLFTAKAHPEYQLVEPEEGSQTIKIDQIRSLKDKQALTQTISNWKAVVIQPADNMTISASNSLLKLLEEPPAQTLFILVAYQPELLPITIKSRCQQLHINTPDEQAAQSWLTERGIALATIDFNLLCALSEGSPLRIETMVQQSMLEDYRRVLEEFDDLLTRPVNPVVLGASWLQYDLPQVFRLFQYHLKNKMTQLFLGETETLAIRQLWAVADCVNTTIKLISSQNNYNKTLLIEAFIISVMQEMQPENGVKTFFK